MPFIIKTPNGYMQRLGAKTIDYTDNPKEACFVESVHDARVVRFLVQARLGLSASEVTTQEVAAR